MANFSFANLFGNLAGKNFAYSSPLDTDIDVAISVISLGLPLEGYTTANEDTEEQHEYVILSTYLCDMAHFFLPVKEPKTFIM